jgi:PAS domain S-box-containing protein
MTRDDSLRPAASGGASDPHDPRPISGGRGPSGTKTGSALTAHTLPSDLARLEFIFESAPVGLSYAFTDVGGRKTRFVNQRLLELCGLNRSDAEDLANFIRVTHPDDRAPQARIVERLERGEIDRYSIDKRYIRPGNDIVWAMLTSRRRRHPDGSYEDVSVIIDITDRKNAESELERFFSVSIDFLTIAGGDGYFKRVNPTVTDILGWTVAEFLATPYMDLVHPDDREATRAAVERQLSTGEKLLRFENRYRHKDGRWRILSWRSVPHSNGLMYGAARDVTESREAEIEIKRLNEGLQLRAAQLEAVNTELEAFSYSVSHDLRAPLRHIQGYVAMLERETEGGLSDKAVRYLATVGKAAHEMGQLIDELLLFSRMGRAEMNESVIDLTVVIAAVRSDLEIATRDRRIEWKISPLPVVRGDRGMLKQLFANLLDNAVKYTRPRSPAVIEIGCAGQEAGRAVLYVRDNGGGFDMQYADKLFGVFQRLHRADEFEGTGVGLANVHRIVLRHGGRTWAEAKADVGATFYFTLQTGESAATHSEPMR